MTRRILVAGVGNIFLGDDGFGVEVATRLQGRPLPDGVTVSDFGIRGVHLAYQLLDGWDLVVLVDALPAGEPPGTVTVLEPDLSSRPEPTAADAALLDAHGMAPDVVFGLLDVLAAADEAAGCVRRVVVVGCEPLQVAEGIGLSEPVAAAVGAAVEAVLSLVTEGNDDGEVGGGPGGPWSRGRGGAGGEGHRAVRAHPADVS